MPAALCFIAFVNVVSAVVLAFLAGGYFHPCDCLASGSKELRLVPVPVEQLRQNGPASMPVVAELQIDSGQNGYWTAPRR